MAPSLVPTELPVPILPHLLRSARRTAAAFPQLHHCSRPRRRRSGLLLFLSWFAGSVPATPSWKVGFSHCQSSPFFPLPLSSVLLFQPSSEILTVDGLVRVLCLLRCWFEQQGCLSDKGAGTVSYSLFLVQVRGIQRWYPKDRYTVVHRTVEKVVEWSGEGWWDHQRSTGAVMGE